jgi:hypothetical protein
LRIELSCDKLYAGGICGATPGRSMVAGRVRGADGRAFRWYAARESPVPKGASKLVLDAVEMPYGWVFADVRAPGLKAL